VTAYTVVGTILDALASTVTGVALDLARNSLWQYCKEIDKRQKAGETVNLNLYEEAIINFLEYLLPGLGAVADRYAKEISPTDWRNLDASLRHWVGDVERLAFGMGKFDSGLSTTPNLEYLCYMNAGCPGMYVYQHPGGGQYRYV
jgi:hypothetical protein